MKKPLCFFMMLLVSLFGWGQSNKQGAILGTVTGPSDAVIAGAQITVHNVDTGLGRTSKTTSSRDYHAQFLTPGGYEVTGEAAGDVSQTMNPFSGKPVELRNPYAGQLIPGNRLPHKKRLNNDAAVNTKLPTAPL